MTLTILSVAYPLAPVGPDAVGGAEQVLTQLDRALVAAGHRSIVVARDDSRTAGILVPVSGQLGVLDDGARQRAWQAHREAIASALRRWPVDLVHLHGIDCAAYLPPSGVPALVTLHLPPDWYPAEMFRPTRPGTWLHCVGAAQHAACPKSPYLLPPIENGVPVEALACGTPVIGFPNGALPDTVEHGRTGFLVDSVDGMADAIGLAPGLDAALCRRAAQRFALGGMTARYFALYRRLARPHRAAMLAGAA